MRETTNLFLINGQPMLVPDADVSVSYEDIDSEEERQYVEQLFAEAATFDFTHPDRLDAAVSVTTKCYRNGYGIAWRNARTGLWKGYNFRIIGWYIS